MKLSLAWIFDHIQADWRAYNVPDLVSRFNQTTAEIESWEHYTIDFEPFAIGFIVEKSTDTVTVQVPEWQKKISLPIRSDALVNQWYVIKKNADYHWATVKDFGATKDGLLPAIYCPQVLQAGGWKKHIPAQDYILELNNTSVTHRPDLWSMRGVARECAALLDVPLKTIDTLIKTHQIMAFDETKHKTKSGWTIHNDAPKACTRFAALPIESCQYCASSITMAAMLCRIDYRPINAIVDCSNYVMADLGQPLHAFDAQKIANKTLGPCMAKENQKLSLLDGSTIELSQHDIVISDAQAPLSLAGIIGGVASAVTPQTTALLIEAAHFDVATIRGSIVRHKIRTESSTRFEKNIDPNQTVIALQRLLALFDKEEIPYTLTDAIISLGKNYQPTPIALPNNFIDDRLGAHVGKEFIEKTLQRLEFDVQNTAQGFTVTPPSFRGLNTITIPEDLVEEVGRFWGYRNITPTLPAWPMHPHNHHKTLQLRAIKNQLAYGLGLHEVNNYPFFDEQFIQSINYAPSHSIKSKNPLSQNMVQLVDSLVPHLFKNVQQNLHKAERIALFEVSRTWHLHNNEAVERTMLAAVWWHNESSFNFYDGKAALQSLFDLIHLPIEWHKADESSHNRPWFSRNQTAHLMYQNQSIGYAGMADNAWTQRVGKGTAFVCELDAEFLRSYQAPIAILKPLAKYPHVFYDVSMLVPMTCTVEKLTAAIHKANHLIYQVQLRDIFEQDAWKDKRSITLRYFMRDTEKTLTKNEADAIHEQVIANVQQLGAQIRS